MVDYADKIEVLKRTIQIRADNHQSTAVSVHRLSSLRTLQIKQEMRDEKKRARLAR